jgi:hypothetical protein
MALALTMPNIALGMLARRLGCPASTRRTQLDARTPCLRQADRDRLLWRPRPVLSFPDMMELFANELTGLGAGGFALALVLASTPQGFFLRHDASNAARNVRRRGTGSTQQAPFPAGVRPRGSLQAS